MRLFKKRFGGPTATNWRKALPAITHKEAVRLHDIELQYRAETIYVFRTIARAEASAGTHG